MPRQHIRSQSHKSITGAALAGLGLDGAACQLSHLFCAIAREALGVLPSVAPAAWQASSACVFDHHWLLECILQMLVSCWPLIHTMAGAV